MCNYKCFLRLSPQSSPVPHWRAATSFWCCYIYLVRIIIPIPYIWITLYHMITFNSFMNPVCALRCVFVLVAQLCPTLCNPMDYSLPGSSIHWIFQARILDWVAISFSRVSSRPRDWTQVSCIAGRCFTIWTTRETYAVRKTLVCTPIIYQI